MGGTVKGPGTSQNQNDHKRTWLDRRDNGDTPGYNTTQPREGKRTNHHSAGYQSQVSVIVQVRHQTLCDTSIL